MMTTNAAQTTYTSVEMLDLIGLHFAEAFSGADYAAWDWSVPYYLLDGVTGWTPSKLEALVDFYHNVLTAGR